MGKSIYDVKIGSTLTSAIGQPVARAEEIALADNHTVQDMFNKTVLDTGDLNSADLLKNGVYEITSATNTPDGKTESGVLTVEELNEKFSQVWQSSGYQAFRSAYAHEKITRGNTDFYLDGTKTTITNKTLTITAGETHTLSGYLDGHIEITSASDPTTPTTIIMNGLFIDSDVERAIDYIPSTSKLIIKLGTDTYNYISSYSTEDFPSNGTAYSSAIYSVNNLEITGVGYLAIRTRWSQSHGIKADEITISGCPHIYIISKHDGIHAVKTLSIENGYIKIAGVSNEALECENEDLHIYGGTIDISDGCDHGISAKTGYVYIEGLSTTIKLADCKSGEFRFPAKTKVLSSVSLIGSTLEKISPETWFGTGSVKIATGTNDAYDISTATTVTPDTNGIYNVSLDSSTQICEIKGYIKGKIVVTNASSDIVLNGAYIKYDNGTPIYYSYSKKKLGVKAWTKTSNYVISTATIKVSGDYDAIKSENNVALSGNGTIYCYSYLEDGIDGSDVTLKGDGLRYFVNCGEDGIKTSTGYIGWDNDDPADTLSSSHIYAFNNKEVDLYGRNGKMTKGSFTIYSNLIGLFYCGKMNAYNGAGCSVLAANVYAKSILNKDIPTANISLYTLTDDYKADFNNGASSVLSVLGSWTILKQEPTDGYYSKNEINPRILNKYENLELANADLSNLAVGSIVSVKGNIDNTDYATDYNLYIVVADLSGVKSLKRAGGGSGSSTSYAVNVADFEILVDGVKQENINSTMEAKLGSKITFSFTFSSENYPDVIGKVYFKNGTTILYTMSTNPDSNIKTWTYDTTGLEAGTYTITIYGQDSSNKQSTRTQFIFEVGSLALASTFDEDNVITANTAIILPLTITAVNDDAITANISFDGTSIMTPTVSKGSVSLLIDKAYTTVGTHTISVYLTSGTKTSNTLTYSVLVAKTGNIYVLPDATSYTISDGSRLVFSLKTIELGYTKFYTTITITNSANTTIGTHTYTLNYGKNAIELIDVVYDADNASEDKTYSEYTISFSVKTDDKTATAGAASVSAKVTKNDYNLSTVTTDMACWFDAKGKSNTADDKAVWDDKAPHASSADKISATFHNFNWKTNGWATDDDGETYLNLSSGAYVELDITPFLEEIASGSGKTISVDFSTKDILNSNAKVISCLYEYPGSESNYIYYVDPWGNYIENTDANVNKFNAFMELYNAGKVTTYDYDNPPYDLTYNLNNRAIKSRSEKNVTLQRGFYIDTQYAVLSNSGSPSNINKKFYLNFSEDTRTTIDFVITRESDNTPTAPYYFSSMVAYTNGMISLMKQITSSNEFKQYVEVPNVGIKKFRVYLGCKASFGTNDTLEPSIISDTGEAKIYSVKIYNRALAPNEILKNYAASIANATTKEQFIKDNGLLSSSSLASSLPEMCLYGVDVNGVNSINGFITQLANDSTQISDLKAMKGPAYVSYTDSTHTENNWTTGGSNYIPIKLQFQGTSSLVYPVHNYKFKLYKTLSINGTTATYGSKVKYDIGNGVSENCFCLKANFMDSSGVNNTQTANFIADYNRGITGNTTAMAINNKVRNTVYGFPVLLYYAESIDSTTKKFLGVYDLNTDKSCNDSYGLNRKVADNDGIKLDLGQSSYIDDDISKLILAKVADATHVSADYTNGYKTVSLYDPDISAYKDYIALYDPTLQDDNGQALLVGGLSEKGYVRSLNNDEISAVQSYEFKANSGAAGAGGFGNYNISSLASDTELRYPDEGDLTDGEYTAYVNSIPTPVIGADGYWYVGTQKTEVLAKTDSSDTKSKSSNNTWIINGVDTGIAYKTAINFNQFKSPYYYQMRRLLAWMKQANSDSTGEKFKNEFSKHFDVNYTLDYYLTILLIGGVDSLGKNLMLNTYGPNNHLYVTTEENAATDTNAFSYTYSDNTTGYITTTITRLSTTNSDGTVSNSYKFAEDPVSGKRLYLNYDSTGTKVVNTTPGDYIWYPTFYDIDTIGGLDNSGQLLFDSDIEIGDQLDDGTMVYNTTDSLLWANIKKWFSTINSSTGYSVLSKRWSDLRASKFTVDNLVTTFYYGRGISKVPAAYYNKDCFQKYIWEGPYAPGETKVDGTTATLGSGTYLYCIHGSRYEQIKHWFSQRIYYLDTMFQVGTFNSLSSSLRFNHAGYDALYGDIDGYYSNIKTNSTLDPTDETRKIYKDSTGTTIYSYDFTNDILYDASKNEIVPITFTFKSYQPGYVGVKFFNGGSIHTARIHRDSSNTIIGNVKTSGDAEVFIYGGSNIKEIGNMNPYNVKQIDFKNLNKLNILDIGGTDSCVINKLDLGSNTYLSELNLNRCISLNDIDVSKCVNLKYLYMTDSTIKSVNIATAGALESIAYSSTIERIDLEDFANLQSIIIGSLSNINTFIIKNCPHILGTEDSANDTVWNLLQQTYNMTSASPTISVTSYGSVTPDRLLSDGTYFFFPNKFYSYSTAANIKGKIDYKGTAIPSNYAKFAAAYPELTITFNNVVDASNMFADYKNLNCISSLQVITGKDSAGNTKYATAYYWTDTQASKYSSAVSSSTYTTSKQFYVDINSGTTYRMLGLYDDTDLDILRAEIKKHISSFSRFTKMDYMFKNMTILDYLDPTTFDGLDISSASTDGMFYNCTNLKYFIVPTSMNFLNADMFYNCKKARIFINNTWGSTDHPSKLNISANAFEYSFYDSEKSTQDSNVTMERPVIFFKYKPRDLLVTTTEATSGPYTSPTTGNPVTYDNIPLTSDEYLSTDSKDSDGNYIPLYYSRANQYGYKVFDTSSTNPYISVTNSTWLRDVYFNASGFTLLKQSTDSTYTYDYASFTNSDNIILMNVKLIGTNIVTEFNTGNSLKLIGITPSALMNLKQLRIADLPTTSFDNFDTSRPTLDAEKVLANYFTDQYYTIDNSSGKIPETLVKINFINSPEIYDSECSGDTNITNISFDATCISIASNAFYNCSRLADVDLTKAINLTSIGSNVFRSTSLASISLPDSLTILGTSVFADCLSLKTAKYSSAMTYVPEACFSNCSILETCSGISKIVTYFGAKAFYACKHLKLFGAVYDNTTQKIVYTSMFDSTGLGFNYFTNLTSIGDYAFYGLNNLTNITLTATVNGVTTDLNARNKLYLPSTLTYIGISAFEQNLDANMTVKNFTEFVWTYPTGGSYSESFVNLKIGANAFSGLKPSWRRLSSDSDKNVYDNIVFLPKVYSIGSSAFKLYDSTNKIEYAITKSSSSIGKTWVSDCKKIIFDYYDIDEVIAADALPGQTSNISRKYIYLLSSSSSEKNAYLKLVNPATTGGDLGSQVFIPATITFDSMTFNVIEILSNAFDSYSMLSEIYFLSGSQLSLIESNVLTSSYITTFCYYDSNNTPHDDQLPPTTKLASGNPIVSTQWYSNYKVTLGDDAFVTLNNYILGYTFAADSTNTTLDIETFNKTNSYKYDTIYDNAFAGKNLSAYTITLASGTKNASGSYDGIKYIFQNAFLSTNLSKITIPEGIETIGERAFGECPFTELYFPSTLTYIGNNAYNMTSAASGTLKTLSFAEGCTCSGYPIVLVKDGLLSSNSSTSVNISLKNLYIPTTMSKYVDSTNSTDFQYAAQVTNLYLGDLYKNDIEGDANYGTYLYPNVPLYQYTTTNTDGSTSTIVTFDSKAADGTAYEFYKDSNGNQLYCLNFYHPTGSTSTAYVETTEKYGVYPKGTFVGNLNLSKIYSKVISSTDTSYAASGFNKEQLLRVLFALDKSTSHILYLNNNDSVSSLITKNDGRLSGVNYIIQSLNVE